MITPQDEHQKRKALWKAGLSDPEAAALCYITRQAYRAWRLTQGLPANRNPGQPRKEVNKC